MFHTGVTPAETGPHQFFVPLPRLYPHAVDDHILVIVGMDIADAEVGNQEKGHC